MKRTFAISAAALLSVGAATAFDIPRGVHEIAGLEEARKEAAENKDPVVFLISRKSLKPT